MLKSMTGYGRNDVCESGKKISVEIKSVNHRYSDYSIKVPRGYGFLEERVKEYAAGFISRGKVDIYISIESYGEAERVITLKSELAGGYIEALKLLRDEFKLADDISVMSVARFTDIFSSERPEEDAETLWKLVKSAMQPALELFTQMREREGGRIEKDLSARIEYMRGIIEKIDARSPKTVEEYHDKLYAKIKELLDGRAVDEGRLLTEVAIFADKVAVNEETVRLTSHMAEFYKIISANEPAGRKLDFLIQEINREVNTIASKANDIEIVRMVVELKGEVEKLREQVQNIE